jgi:hypothetical protein
VDYSQYLTAMAALKARQAVERSELMAVWNAECAERARRKELLRERSKRDTDCQYLPPAIKE